MDIIQNERFKCEFMDVPFKKTENSIDHYEAQIKAHVLDFLHDNYGVDTSDEALRKTIESIVQFVQTAAQSDDAASPAA